jgi:hypothetical protein
MGDYGMSKITLQEIEEILSDLDSVAESEGDLLCSAAARAIRDLHDALGTTIVYLAVECPEEDPDYEKDMEEVSVLLCGKDIT